MLQTLIATFVLFLVVTLAMSVGAVFTGRSLRGSCGGNPDKSCGCTTAKRQACEAKAAGGARHSDGARHLDVVDDDA